MENYYFPNRTLCDVLEDMRKANKTHNYSYLLGLIEEAQVFGNRMEAALGDNRDIKQLNEERSKLRKEVKALQATTKKLGKKGAKK